MTRQADNRARKGGKAHDTVQAASLDPRMVSLVKYLARRAAERDYEAIQNASLNETTLSGEMASDDAGADS